MAEVDTTQSQMTPFGVRLRPRSESSVSRKNRVAKSLSMSFLESSLSTNRRLCVKEFTDPFDIKPDRDGSNLASSRNKWSTSVSSKVELQKNISNNNLNKNDQGQDTNRNDRGQDKNNNYINSVDNGNKRSSCTFSSDVFFTGKDEINAISDNAKPLLRLWASRSKLNVAKKKNNVSNDSTSNLLNQGLDRKYFKQRPLSSSEFSPGKGKSVSCLNLSYTKENTERNTGVVEQNAIKTSEAKIKQVIPLNKASYKYNNGSVIGDSEKKKITTHDSYKEEKYSSVVTTAQNQSHKPSKNDNSASVESITQRVPTEEEDNKNKKERVKKHTGRKLIKIKSLDLRDLHRKYSKQDELKPSALSSPEQKSPENTKERKYSFLPDKQDKKTASNKKKERKTFIKRSESVDFKSEYVHVDFLQQPQKVEITDSKLHREQNNEAIIGVGKKTIISNPDVKEHRKISVTGRKKSVDNSDTIYNAKERIERIRKFSIKECEIDIDPDPVKKDTTEVLYTNINNQISEVFESRKTSVQENTRRKSTTKIINTKNNIALARTKSEPAINTKQTIFYKKKTHDTEAVSFSNSDTENLTNQHIINDSYRIDMTNQYQNRFSPTPGFYCDQNTSLKTSLSPVERSIKHSDSYSDIKYKDKYTKNNIFYNSRESSENRSTGNDNTFESTSSRPYLNSTRRRYSTTSEPSCRTEQISKDIISTSTDNYYPKSNYMRKRLQEINNERGNSSEPLQLGKERQHIKNRLQKSVSASQARYNPAEVDTFIKAYRDRQFNYNNQPSSDSVTSSEFSNSKVKELFSVLTKTSTSTKSCHENIDSSVFIGRTSRSSSQSSTSSLTNLEERRVDKRERFPSRGSNNSDSGYQKGSFDCDEMDHIFGRNISLRLSGSRFTRNDSSRLSDRSSDGKKSPFLRNLSSRSSEKSNRSLSPPVSDNSLVPSSGDSSPTATKFSSPSIFSSIRRVHSSKISGADELKSTARRKSLKTSEAENKTKALLKKSDSKTSDSIVTIDGSKNQREYGGSENIEIDEKLVKNSKFPLHKKKQHDSLSPSSPKAEKHRKHSVSSYFNFKKEKNKEKESPVSPKLDKSRSFDQGDLRNEGPLSPSYNKERRGSALLKLFHKKSHLSSSSETAKDGIQSIAETHNKSTDSQSLKEEPKSKSLNITINGIERNAQDELVKSDEFTHIGLSSKDISDNETPDQLSTSDTVSTGKQPDLKNMTDPPVNETSAINAALLIPGIDDMGSADSLYDGDLGSKSRSRNKERIRNRKAARKEALERHKSLPAGFGDIEIDFSTKSLVNGVSAENESDNPTGSQASVTSTTQTPRTRKKHKARRANTEFIMNAPSIAVQQASPLLSRDDGIVMRRNNKRNQRRVDRPRTLTAGIDPDLIFGQKDDSESSVEKKSGVVNENLSFAEVKKKLLEGLTDDKKVPEKVPVKERQKIRRTKSTKRYKTITEGIAPRDLELAKQAMEVEHGLNGTKTTIDKETLAQITAALTSTNDKRKSFIVESRPNSRYQSFENLHMSDENLKAKDDSIVSKPPPRPRALQRTKSMATMHLQLDHEDDENEVEIKPLSELKNRFLQAMEDTKQKHLSKKTPIEIKQRNKKGRGRNDRPHTICGLDDFTMEQLQYEIGNVPDSNLKKNEEKKQEEGKQLLVKENQTQNKNSKQNIDEKSQKREKKRYQGANSQKIFDDLFDDIDDILDQGVSESDLADVLGCNPSLHQESTRVDLELRGNTTTDESTKKEESTTKEEIITNKPQEPLSDLDFISSQTTQLSSTLASDKRNLRPQRKHRTGVNPVKALQHREDLVDETEVTNKPKEERKSQHPVVDAYRGLKQTAENKGSPVDRLLKRNDLADEAVSALRATVDFTKTKLKKVEVGKRASDVFAENFNPTEISNILLQVKGRKKCQTTVVEFKPESLNSNDCFIVVTPKELLCWNGAQSNVIERAKAAEIASRINQKKEMDCKAFEVIYVDQGAPTESKVLRALGGNSSTIVDLRRPVVNDEDFEKTMTSSYMTYIVCEVNETPELIPLDSQCHRMPSKEILQTDSTFVFDFITEVYVWLGRQTGSQQRKLVQELAAEKFKDGHYKLILEASPLHHLHASHLGTSRKISVTATTAHHRRGSKPQRRVSIQQGRHQKREMVPRPDHSLLLQLYEGSEWVIFKEKFCDWPDESRIIRLKGGASAVGEVTKNVSTEINIEVVDATTMVTPPPTQKMVLENLDIGRGRGIPKGMDGYHIITLDVKTWHVSENNSLLMPDESFGQFHSGEGYVIRWHYRIVKVRALRHCSDVMKAGGSERCCYFFWLGNDCTVNEEGATAVMTIELDSEKGPQIRVVLGKEPPALLNLFDGCMVIHAGKRPAPGVRDDFSDQSAVRLYTVRNEEESEACLLQVPAVCESLRSRSSFVLLLCSQGELFLWHGCRSNEGTKKAAEHAAQMLIQNHPEEAAIGEKSEIFLTEVEEGEEPDVFWLALGGKEDYGCLLNDSSDLSNLSPRLFQLESTTGKFISHEILCPSKTPIMNCPFPVLQDDMYNVEQPAIFLLDATTHVYLWFGWWPDEDDTEAVMSHRRRYDEERRKAMESAVLYATEAGRALESLYAVYAGLEPESFIELFPYWVVQDDITDIQLDEGIEEDKLYKITEELAMFTKDFYTLEELQAKPPPQGVDPTKLEKYLSEEGFLEVFRFHKETFYKLPVWQQTNWKKKVGLY